MAVGQWWGGTSMTHPSMTHPSMTQPSMTQPSMTQPMPRIPWPSELSALEVHDSPPVSEGDVIIEYMMDRIDDGSASLSELRSVTIAVLDALDSGAPCRHPLAGHLVQCIHDRGYGDDARNALRLVGEELRRRGACRRGNQHLRGTGKSQRQLLTLLRAHGDGWMTIRQIHAGLPHLDTSNIRAMIRRLASCGLIEKPYPPEQGVPMTVRLSPMALGSSALIDG